MTYPEKLKFMDENCKGFASFETEDGVKYSVRPQTTEEQVQYNEWRIKLFESLPDFDDFSFARLRQGYERIIATIRKNNQYPDNAIERYTADELVKYRLIMERYPEFNGTWDLTKEIDYPRFVKARAVFNYVGYLESKLVSLKPTRPKMPVIPERALKSIYNKYDSLLWKHLPQTEFLKLFDPDNESIGSLEASRRGYQILIGYLFKNVCQKFGQPFNGLKERIPGMKKAGEIVTGRKSQHSEMLGNIDDFIKKMQVKATPKMGL